MNTTELLKQYNELLIRQNERLIAVLEAFASKDINVRVINNSYNGTLATSKSVAETKDNSKGNVELGNSNTI